MTRPRHTDGAPSPLLRPALTFARRRKGPLGALGAWSLLESARTFLTGYAVARALDDGFLAGDVRTGLLWLLALAAAALAGGFADAGVFRALGGVIEPLRDSLVRRVVRATLIRAVASPTPADTARVSRLTAQTEIARDAAGGVLLTVRSFLFTSAGAFTGLAALSPRLLPLVLIPLTAGLALFAATLRPMAARQRDLLDADEHLAAFAGRTDHAARDIAATGAAPLKDFMYAKQIFELISFFFDGESGERDEFRLADDEIKAILNDYLAAYDHNDDNSMWFNKLKEIADKNGYASDMKAYKANPENFKGNVSDVAEVVRIAVTGRANTPDLWTIVHIMGEEQMKERISRFL